MLKLGLLGGRRGMVGIREEDGHTGLDTGWGNISRLIWEFVWPGFWDSFSSISFGPNKGYFKIPLTFHHPLFSPRFKHHRRRLP